MAEPQNTDTQKIENKPQQSVLDQLATWSFGLRSFARLAYYKISNLEKSNLELGIKQLKSGNYFDSYWRFRFVILLNKNNAIAHYLMGKSLFYRGKFAESARPLNQALKLKPDLDEARFLLAAGGNPADIKSIPRSFIIEKLDFLSTRYDEFIEGTSSHVTKILEEEFHKIIGDNMGFNVLDLGCRGGDTSQILRTSANAITGVEPSLKLSAIARIRRHNDLLTFNSLMTRFPEDYLKEAKEKFSVVISTYYMDNLGAVDEYFRLVENVIDQGGLFAFNINVTANKEDYTFRPQALIFAHNPAYIERLAIGNRFKILAKREAEYPNGSKDIIYVLEKQ